MGVRVQSDCGPSYTLHEPTPASGSAVCANCIHVNKRGMASREFCEAWTCDAAPVEIKRPAGTDPITGEHVPAWTIGTRCTARNKAGECPDFQAAAVRERPGKIGAGGGRKGEPDDADPIAVALAASAISLVIGASLGAAIMAVVS